MQKHRKISLERVEKFKGKLQLEGKFYEEIHSVTIKHWKAPDRVGFNVATQQQFLEGPSPLELGPLWATHWLHVSFNTPEQWKNRGEIHFVFDCGGEAQIWSPTGVPLHALNGQTGEDRRERFRLYPSPEYEELSKEFYVECACNELFGNSNWEVGPTPPDPSRKYFIKKCHLALVLPSFWKLYHDYILIADIAKQRDEDSWESCEALRVANEMINLCNLEDPMTFPMASKLADEYFHSERGRNSGFQLTAVGHCHIDTAWLWPYAETKRKCARSWATQLRLMERYPQYKFACSQAQQYAWVKEDYPSLFSQIQSAVTKGNFIPVGGTWVEMDCNIPSGESLVRQFLYGQQFFKENFDVPSSPIFWLPDTFGYAAQLPQIIRSAGMKYFLTQKLSWNQINKFPHNTFVWEGIDGSRVITHFPPADNYCSHANAADVYKSEHNFKDKERSSEALLVYGHGDGGGGPNPKMLETLTRMSESAFGGLPSVQFGSPVDFFERIEKDVDRYCVWTGELYFEYHRGTYTTQAKNKLYNRRAEDLMREVELLACISTLHGSISSTHQEEIKKWWKLILLNQFHDVIPGTSIHCVYEDSNAHYQSIFTEANHLRTDLLHSVLSTTENEASDGNSQQFVIVNSLGFDRKEIINISSVDWLPSEYSVIQENQENKLAVVDVPSCGFISGNKVILQNTDQTVKIEQLGEEFIISNKWIEVQINRCGHITSLIWVETGRSLIEKGKHGNHLVLFDDHPLFWDAWDVDVYHLEKRIEFHQTASTSCSIVESGPLRVALEYSIPISEKSSLKQVIRVTSESPLIEFDTTVQWHESHRFLKVEFPFTIRSQQCTYEIPYGWVQRPTHFNTSWDLARFEVCAHRWADLSEFDFGVALLNDCKYGYSTRGSMMTLSLLRSPKAPDETADMGEQTFRYAIFPHNGSFQTAGVVHQGLRFNNPLQVKKTKGQDAKMFSFAKVTSCWNSVILDHVKTSEDGKGMILRLFEAHGGSVANCTVQLSKKADSIEKVNLLEEPISSSSLAENTSLFTLSLLPFEIVSIKVIFPTNRT